MMGLENTQLFTVDDVMETVALDETREVDPLRELPGRSSWGKDDSSLESGESPFTREVVRSLQQHRNSLHGRSYRSPSGKSELLIEPPSYADVIFTPYMGQGSNGSLKSGDSVQPTPVLSRDYLKITVSDPQRIQESSGSVFVPGGGTYVTYLITTHTNILEFEGTEFNVRRRFREVVALADKLAEVYKGYFIPPRPDKNVVEGQVMDKQEFVEQRCAALNRYFARLAAHPVLRKSEELRAFLGKHPFQISPDVVSVMLDGVTKLPGQLLGDVSTSDAVQEPAKGGNDFVRAFKELRQYVANDWGGTKPLVVEGDKKFIERKEKLQELERELVRASEQAELLVKAQEEIGTVMGDLGISLSRLGQFEGEDPPIAAGNAAVKASRCHREANTECMRHLDNIHEYLALMQAVNGAFWERSKALLTVQTQKSDLASVQARLEKLTAASMRVFGGDRRKVEELKAAVKTSEEACAAAQAEYDSIKERNWEDIERYELERQKDFFWMLKGFVQTQVGYAEKLSNVWTDVAENAWNASMSSSIALY